MHESEQLLSVLAAGHGLREREADQERSDPGHAGKMASRRLRAVDAERAPALPVPRRQPAACGHGRGDHGLRRHMARGLDRQRFSGERADAGRADVHDIHDFNGADLNQAFPHHVNVQRAELHPADLHDIHVLNDGCGHDFDRIVDRHEHVRLVSPLPSSSRVVEFAPLRAGTPPGLLGGADRARAGSDPLHPRRSASSGHRTRVRRRARNSGGRRCR